MTDKFTARWAKIEDMNNNIIQDLFNRVKRTERLNGRSPLGSPCYPEWMNFIQRQQNGEVRYQFLVVEDKQNKVIGFCIARHTLKMDHTTLEKMVILPEYQHIGIGKFLLKKVFELAKSLNKINVRVKAESGKCNASMFYIKQGFILVDKKQNKSGSITDVLEYNLSVFNKG
jgi:N-acetylglutamate synthase-like GNAT family acetyltransferase